MRRRVFWRLFVDFILHVVYAGLDFAFNQGYVLHVRKDRLSILGRTDATLTGILLTFWVVVASVLVSAFKLLGS